jgi:hypothetical protein
MAINYTNLNFGNQGLKNLITASFTSSWVTASGFGGAPGIILSGSTSGNNYQNYSYLTADGYYQIFPSRSSYNFDSLLPIVAGDIITFDSGAFGTLGGSITRKIIDIKSDKSLYENNNIFLVLDSAITGAYNSSSWVINRRVESENYMMLEMPYDAFGINISSSIKEKITGFILPQSYHPDLAIKLDEIAGKSGLGPATIPPTGSSNLGGFMR